MQNFKPKNFGKMCLALLSLTLLAQSAFGYDEDKISLLDRVSDSYLRQTQMPASTSSLLNLNSYDARTFETTLRLDSTPVITNSDKRVNLSLRESDLKQALRMIADKAGLNIVFDKSVEGDITLDLKNIKINDAFLVIFKSCQLTYTLDGNTITVMSLDAAKDVAYSKQTMTFLPVKYANAESVADFMNNNVFGAGYFGLSNQPSVTAIPSSNQIVVFGNIADVNAVKRVLPVIDTKPMINSFKVNHTTPKEMASLICNSLFYGMDGDIKEDNTSDDEDEVVLGGGTVACKDDGVEKKGGSSYRNSGNSNMQPFKSNPLSIAYFPDLGKITTYGGSVEQIEIIRDFIKEHDKKQLMAYVELSVIELNETGSKEFSNSWNLWSPFINLSFDQGGLTTTRNNPFFIWGHDYASSETTTTTDKDGNVSTVTNPTTISKSNNKALVYQLTYLIENGNGRVLTNPKIMVTNGKKAVIDMTSDYVKSVTSQVLQSSSSITSATQKTYDIGSDEGLLIEIVPFISPDGYVSMNISPEFATIKERVYSTSETGSNEIAATLLQRRDLELKNVRIRDGETLVLAGLIKENETQTTTKMPLLGDLPFLGVFFRSNSNSKSREELVIVVTPHIVKDNTEVDNQIYDL